MFSLSNYVLSVFYFFEYSAFPQKVIGVIKIPFSTLTLVTPPGILHVALRGCFAWQTRKASGYRKGIVSYLRMYVMIDSSVINSQLDASHFSLFARLVFHAFIPVCNMTEYWYVLQSVISVIQTAGNGIATVLCIINVERRKEMRSSSICNATTDSRTTFFRDLTTSKLAKAGKFEKVW